MVYVKLPAMLFSGVAAVIAYVAVSVAFAPPVLADPDANAPPPADAAAAPDGGPPPDEGRVPSAPPQTTKTPDGWTWDTTSAAAST
jgi:hypothetical protein